MLILEKKDQWTCVQTMNPWNFFCVVFNNHVRENLKMFLESLLTLMFHKMCQLLLLMFGMNPNSSMIVFLKIQPMGEN
jgi:hypothetical protein